MHENSNSTTNSTSDSASNISSDLYSDAEQATIVMTEQEKSEQRRLVAAKGQCKATFTRLEKFFADSERAVAAEELLVRKNNLINTYDKYQELSLSLQLLGDTADEEGEIEERYYSLMAVIDRKTKISPGIHSQNTVGHWTSLPVPDLPIFDGINISGYKPFIEMFNAVVHEDQRISAVQKLCLLKKYVRGEPLQIIDSLPIIGQSYESALELIKKRYDNPALLINSHVTSLLDLPSLQRGTAYQLRDLVAKVRQHVIALKNLKQPVTQWDALLSCIIMRKLDSFTVRLFHAERDAMMIVTIEELLNYLDKRASALEASPSINEKLHGKTNSFINIAASSKSMANKLQCILCTQDHRLFKCPDFNSFSPEKRIGFVDMNKLCNICLNSHPKKCKYKFTCTICHSRSHNTLIHQNEPVKKVGECDNRVNLHIAQPVSKGVLLPTAKVIVHGAGNKRFVVKALLDCGSQTSFCTTVLANQLELSQFNLHKNIGTLGDICSSNSYNAINLPIESVVCDYKLNISCSIIDKITSKLPQNPIDLRRFIIPKNVTLADNEFHIPGEISLLLASDIFFKIIKDGKIEGGPTDPILLNTQLGYIVSSTGYLNFNKTVSMHVSTEPDIDFCVRQFWEVEKVPEIYQECLPEHEYTERVFNESVTMKNNSFEVKFPLKVDLSEIEPSNSYAIALQRLYTIERRFIKDPLYHDLYKRCIHEYLDLQHAKIIDIENCEEKDKPLFFLPHHAVLRSDKQTNKLRVVFDGSARTKSGLSLNDFMCNGPVVQRSLFDILLLFRIYKFVIQCDIRHMYRMIKIHPNHRCLQNILWREDGVMSVLQLQTVTYGLKSSAFLATRCLVELARRYKDEYPLASEAILNNCYVDDIQAGSNSIEGAIKLKCELNSISKLANFKLHKWVSNCPELLEDVPQESLGIGCRSFDQDRSVFKILGLSYDAKDDVFQMSGHVIHPKHEIPTKRNVLSSISRLFDPMGFAGPVITKAKIFLQELWQHNLDWDTPLPNELRHVWESFYTNLTSMPTIIIPRYLQTAESNEIQLIGYCDASTNAYGCCIYLKVKIEDKIHIHLLCSKSRVNALNSKLTIPKLELNGALLLAKVINHVSATLNVSDINLFCDSKIVLGWLNASPIQVPAYIGNRIKEIKRFTQDMPWRFTPSIFNPADILSRGADPLEIDGNSLWKRGPDYLLTSCTYNLYMAEIERPLDISMCENNNIFSLVNKDPIDPLLERYSSLYKTIHVMVYVLRFVNKCKRNNSSSQEISVAEFREALAMIIKGVQRHYFAEEIRCLSNNKDIKSSILALHPFLDAKGILRVGGRLRNADLDFSTKFPIILPKHCHITRLIIRQEHLALMHGGLKLVFSHLLQKYYIINAIREIKSIIHKCVICCRHKAETSKQLMGSLPRDRVNPSRVFEKVGLDYCGPFEIKQSSKRNSIVSKGYVALFVCFASKALHLEVVSDMSTDTFMSALKRFVARRGVPTDLYCDNAKTFRGADKQLKELFKLHNSKEFQNTVHNYALQKEIQFHFIPAYSPNHGGLWEAGVKSAKFHLKRISTFKIFTYEQFNTIMIEIESILNSRPLMSVTNQDSSDFNCLTPGHFIIGCPLTSIPQPNLIDIPTNRLRFWRCCEQIRQHFWKVWSKDYLSSLNQRTKWKKILPNLKEGTVVLLLNPNNPPLQWPLGRVTKIFYGKDNNVRVVEVKTCNGKLHTRAISKIVVLPIE